MEISSVGKIEVEQSLPQYVIIPQQQAANGSSSPDKNLTQQVNGTFSRKKAGLVASAAPCSNIQSKEAEINEVQKTPLKSENKNCVETSFKLAELTSDSPPKA